MALSVPTFHEVVMAHHQKQDGTYNVKIRVTFKRQIRYLPTTIVVTKDELTRGMKIRNQAKIDAIEVFKRQLRDAMASANIFELDAMDVDGVIDYILNYMKAHRELALDFFAYGREVANRKPKRSGDNYRTALRSFEEYVGKPRLDISEITSSLLRNYEASLRQRLGDNARAVSLYTSSIAHIHKCAREEFNNEELDQIYIKNPYQYYTPAPHPETEPRAIDLDVLRLMWDTREKLTGRARLGVDMFLLSFCMMGMNVPDIYEATPPVEDVITYNRTKTRTRRRDNAEARVRLEWYAKQIEKDYKSHDHIHAFNLYARYADYKGLGDAINRGLKAWQKAYEKPAFTMYAARHTWATAAYAAGMNPAYITDGLVHRDPGRKMDNIYTKKDWKVLWDENLKVLDYALGL